MYGLHTAPKGPYENLRNCQVDYFTCRAMGRAFVVLAEAKFVHEKSGNRRNGKAPSNMVAAKLVQPFLPNSGYDAVPPMKAVDSVETFADAALWHGGLHDVGEVTLDRFSFGI